MERILKDQTANPAPLGLFGFAMTTFLLNLHNAGFYQLDVMIMSMGIFMADWRNLLQELWSGKKVTLLALLLSVPMAHFG